MNKKGQGFTIFHFMIVAFLVVLLFAGLIWVQGQLYDVFTEIGLSNEKNADKEFYVNLTQASDDIWGHAYTSIQSLRMVAFVYLLSMAVLIVVTGALERKHPLMFFIYILITLLGVLFAPTISNAYETITASGIFDDELANFTASNFILQNLPTIVLLIGVLGAVFLFINLIRGGNEENFNLG